MKIYQAPAGAPTNVVSLDQARQNCRTKETLNCSSSDAENTAHARFLKFPKRAHDVHTSKAQRVAHSRASGLHRKSKTSAPVKLPSKAACNAQIRGRIADVAVVLNLSSEEIKPAMKLNHEHLAAFAKKRGVNIEWLIAGTGCVFRSRGELFERAIEFELLVKSEKGLRSEFRDRRLMADRLAYEKAGIDPDDSKACASVHQSSDTFEAWRQAADAAEREIDSSNAWDKWNSAVNQRVKAGKEIKRRFGPPASQLGLLIHLRLLEVIEDQDDVADLMIAEIRAFFARGRAGKIAADCGH